MTTPASRRSSLALLACLGVVVAGCASSPRATVGSSATSTRPVPTSVVTSTVPSTLVTSAPAPTATATSGVSTTTDDPAAGFDPPCRPMAPVDAVTTQVDEHVLDQFGPLAIEPVLDIALPTFRDTATSEPDDSFVASARIPGGVLIGLSPGENSTTSAGLLAAVDLDGQVRWQRCLDEPVWRIWVGAASTRPTQAVLHVGSGLGTTSADLLVVSLDDGSTTGTLADLITTAGLPGDLASRTSILADRGDALVLGSGGDGPRSPSDQLVVVDLSAKAVATVGMPPVPPTVLPDLRYAYDDRGDLVADEGGPVAVLRDGTWHTSAADLDELVPLRVGTELDATGSLRSVTGASGSGAVVWRRNDIHVPLAEGRFVAPAGPLSLVIDCPPPTDPGDACASWTLLGIDRSGTTVWQLPGATEIEVATQRYAIVAVQPTDDNGPIVDLLVDTTTGLPVEGQRWPGSAFDNACCGESDFVFTERFGGVVLASGHERLTVYAPLAADLEPHRATVPANG